MLCALKCAGQAYVAREVKQNPAAKYVTLRADDTSKREMGLGLGMDMYSLLKLFDTGISKLHAVFGIRGCVS